MALCLGNKRTVVVQVPGDSGQVLGESPLHTSTSNVRVNTPHKLTMSSVEQTEIRSAVQTVTIAEPEPLQPMNTTGPAVVLPATPRGDTAQCQYSTLPVRDEESGTRKPYRKGFKFYLFTIVLPICTTFGAFGTLFAPESRYKVGIVIAGE